MEENPYDKKYKHPANFVVEVFTNLFYFAIVLSSFMICAYYGL